MPDRDLDFDLTRRRLLGLGLAAAGARVLGPAGVALGATGGPRAVSATVRLPYGRRLGPVRVPGGLDLAGLRWPGGAHVSAQLRARRAGGRWSPWFALGDAHDHAPDRGGAGGTDPVWTGRADEVELRLARPVHGLVLHTVRTYGARRAARAHSAQAANGQPPIIPRSAWGGDGVPPRTGPEYGTVQMAFVHHTVNGNDYAPEDSAGIVLAICRYHRDTNGWNDIGYNFLVDKYGQIFEGRAGGIDQPIVGAQAQGFNSYSTGVANIGTYESVQQTPVALDAMARLIAWKMTLHGAPVTGQVTVTSNGGSDNRYPFGTPVTFERIPGHRDADKTACPGSALYAQLPELRSRAAAIAATLGPVSHLTLVAAAQRLTAPAPAALSGVLVDPSGQPIAGAPVAIQIQGKTAWSTLATAVTGADGAYATQLALARNARLRARFVPSSGGEVVSAPVAMTVVPVVTARASTRRVRAGSAVRVRVAVSPKRDDVVLDLARQVGPGRYVAAGTVRVPVKAGRGTAAVRLRRAGLYRIVARAPRDARAAEARAPWVFVRATRGR